MRAQITAWRAAVIERREMADRYRAAATASADEIERIALVSYEAGERGILELEAAVREAEIELEFVSGWEIP